MKKALINCSFFFFLFSCQSTIYDSFENGTVSLEQTPFISNNEEGEDLHELPNGIVVEKYDDSTYIWQDDMLFSERSLDFLISDNNRAAFRTEAQYYWPGGVVFYKYNSNYVDTIATRIALDYIEGISSIRFLPASLSTPNYIEFLQDNENNSYIGMQGGQQYIRIYNVGSYGIITHEIMHALGFFHEQSRTDRDDYININWYNIRPNKMHNFYKFNVSYTGTNLGTFDFNSIMLYSSFIKDSSFVYDTTVATMTKKDNSTFIGQRTYLSSGDLQGISAIYGPPFHRLESHIDEVIAYELGGSTDKLIVDKTDSIVFYQNRECTTRAALSYPRQIRVKTNHRFFMWGGEDYDITTYQTIEIPAGTSAYHLDSWREIEWYEQSDPYYLDMKTNSIVNYHVNSYAYSSPLLPD